MCSQGHENGTQPEQSQVIPYVVCGTISMASSYFWFITACSKLDCPVICQKYRCLSGAQYNAVTAKGSCDASPVEATPYVMGFFPKICVSVSIPGMGMGTGRSLAVVCCWWGQRERGEHEGEEVAPHGAIPALAATPSRDRGWSLFWCLCWTRESNPSCVCLCECQKPHPEGSSEPLGDLSSHPLPPRVSSCRSWVSLDPLAANSTSASQCPCPQACPLSLWAEGAAHSQTPLVSAWAALELLRACRTARVQRNRDTGPVPISSGTSTCRFPWQVWVLSDAEVDPLEKFWIIRGMVIPEYKQCTGEGKNKGICTSEAG